MSLDSTAVSIDARHRWWRISLRARTTLAAVVVFSGALALGGPAFYLALQRAEIRSLDATLTLQVNTLANLIHQRALPASLAGLSDETSFAQVVDSQGRVIAQSPSTEGQGPLAHFSSSLNQASFRSLRGISIGSSSVFRVASYRVESSGQRYLIYAGTSLAALNVSLHDARQELLVGGPAMLALVALLTWWLVGGALRPVESIRAEVAAISGGDLHKRVATPLTRDEVARLATTMNEMLERLDVADQRLRAFVADASHELKSPLAAAQSELEVSVIHGTRSDWPDAARAALGDLERVRRIVDDLAALARFDGDRVKLRTREVDLDELVVAECTRLARVAPVEIDYHDVSGARVLGDPELLQRMVRNLLDNAVAHARTRVSVRLDHDQAWVALRVGDDGPGVPLEQRERIFERFVRLDESRTRATGGSGLGLAIVAEIVASHAGNVAVAPSSEGAEFVVRLPTAGAGELGVRHQLSPAEPT